jgi:hypothetical protein
MKAKHLISSISSLIVLALFAASCASPIKLAEIGDYDQAIERSVNRLAGKERKNEELVRTVEFAFEKATTRDMDQAEALRAENRAEIWPRVYDIYQRIERRQRLVEPLIPLVDRRGYKASFRFVRVEGLLSEAREKAAQYHYERATDWLSEARRSKDKTPARRAYEELDRIREYYSNYRDREALQREAQHLGTTFILVDVENRAPVILPIGFDRELSELSFRDLNDRWRVFHRSRQGGIDYDLKATLMLRDVQVSPGTFRERQYEEQSQIQDGWAYEYDTRGNVKKDSAGNDIKYPNKVNIRALVTEVYQQKAARLNAQLELLDLRSGAVIDSRPLGAEAYWENYAATFQGDERALSRETRSRIGNRPGNFPDDAWMILDAARRLRPVVVDQLRQLRI